MGVSHASPATEPSQLYTSTVTIGSMVSTSPTNNQTVVNGPFTVLSTTGTDQPCEFWTYNFNATVGQSVSGGFSSDSPISFFIVQQGSYQNWVKAGTCGSATDAITNQPVSTGYSFGPVAIPSAGTWTIALVNSSDSRNAEGTVSVFLSSGTGYTVTQPIMSTITTATLATSALASLVSNSAGQATSIPGFSLASIVAGVMLGLLVVGTLRRRKMFQ